MLDFLNIKPELIRAPGNAALILLVLTFFDSFLWKFPVFNFLIKVPYIGGRYEGKIYFEFNGKAGEKDCVIEIVQTASKIKLHSYFSNSSKEDTSSKSLVENIIEEDGFFKIFLLYLNSGAVGSSALDCHEGANTLKFIPEMDSNPKKLIGHYFTNRNIQTRGTMDLFFVSKELKGYL